MTTAALFSARNQEGTALWITDGTRTGTRILEGPGGGEGFVSFDDGRVLFTSNGGLWVTDGTQAGTTRFADLRLVPRDYGETGRLPDGRLTFLAQSAGDTGVSLWVTDGTAAGTTRVATVASNPATFFNGPNQTFTPLADGSLLFRSVAGGLGGEPWVTDGTTAGTRPIADINPSGGSIGNFLGRFEPGRLGDGRAVFEASDGTGEELWITDGTAAGTQLLKDIDTRPRGEGSFPEDFTTLRNGDVLFTALETGSDRGLWVTDGTTDGTVRLVETVRPFTLFQDVRFGDGRVLFTAFGRTGIELWATDGTEAGTVSFYRFAASAPFGQPRQPVAIGDGRIAFFFDDGVVGEELWITDGTAAGTGVVADIRPGSVGSRNDSFPTSPPATLPDGRILFSADDGTNGAEPWISDGTAAGTLLLRNLYPGNGRFGPNGSFPDDIFVADFPDLTGNTPPTVAMPIADVATAEDAPFVFDVPAGTFGDADAGDTLTLTATTTFFTTLPAWLRFDAATGRFSGNPTNAEAGDYELRVTAIDQAGASASSVFTLTVLNVNDAPTVVAEPRDRRLGVNQDLRLFATDLFADIDRDDILTLSFTTNGTPGLPAWLLLAGNGSLVGRPGYADIGETTIVITATDSAGATAVVDFTLEIFDPAIGTPDDDVLAGTNYDDRIFGDRGADRIDGRLGLDLLFGQAGNDTITGSGGLLGGGLGRNLIVGSGAATLRGGEGDDTLGGDAFGQQELRGGRGQDVFRIGSTNEGQDIIQDFRPSKDRLELQGDVFRFGLGPLDRVLFEVVEDGLTDRLAVRLTYDPTDGRLFYDVDGRGSQAPLWLITLAGAPDLSAADFSVVMF